jgi:hypothetical protein
LQQASRFLAQATNGASRADIAALATTGLDLWLAGQFAMPCGESHWSWMKAQGIAGDPANANYKAERSHVGWDCSIWHS